MDEITSNKAAVPGSPQPFDRRWAVLAIIAVAQLMTALDATIVNIALPSAQHSQGFDDSGRDLCRRRRRHGMAVSRQPAGAPGALRRAGRPAGVVHHRHRRHPQLELPVLGVFGVGPGGRVAAADIDPGRTPRQRRHRQRGVRRAAAPRQGDLCHRVGHRRRAQPVMLSVGPGPDRAGLDAVGGAQRLPDSRHVVPATPRRKHRRRDIQLDDDTRRQLDATA